ncbi:adenosine kinase [Coemansia spiralis]|uniref:Adenosine kinase n=2 Tax=Coemansia TaxID=4863 RepID=A0A9W8G5K8_9FUNG|nr:adenosine kinase [Coemansia spiralis]KAJ1990972.1 adenosine kinase [Coemansia umbellata]KAJ2620982.1 adenosine kinase [Coemansia sp. RSA 1358]KAJ2675731.1 adenosine kinase [Coemansia spiralis]
MSQNLRGALIGFCNPLLDISAVVEDGLLAEYKLKANDAIMASEEHLPLFQTLMDKYDPKLLPGGSAQNTLRGAQLLLPEGSAVFFGAVGADENAKKLKQAAEKAKLRTNYMVNESKPTGTCALLITGHNRSMVANLSAAETYSFEHVRKPENWKDIENAQFYYITGFFVAVSPDTIQAVAQHALDQNKTFMMNISAPFVAQFFMGLVEKTLPYIDILFGNESEALTLAEGFKWAEGRTLDTSDVKWIAKRVADLPKLGKKPRLVVFTQGALDTVVASSSEEGVRVYPVSKIPDSEIGDTNGAGDGFVAGFLAEYMQGRSVDTCIEAGHWLGGQVVRQIGPNYPEGELNFTPSASFAPAIEKI